MVRSIGVQIGLLAFAVAIAAGVYANNPATVVLLRAMAAMVLGLIVGQVAGWAAKLVLRDHLQRRKLSIDQQHFEAIRLMTKADEEPELATEVAEPGIAQ